ncbi:hypothetical protein GCM10012289_77300 [Nonomuraea cavernae]|uniref:Uncharacterized protein n=1 Tax=Nonomuraea cavernae TaxID=2045107 RepID=A0A917ZHZ8_9ACTN|nr:hypothetical protein GCM10012289_77300 [Nonomuraea cavernae]
MDASNLVIRREPGVPVRRLLVTVLRILDEWAFRDLDARARARGWEVHRPAPLTRVYRSPRLGICPTCAGEGFTWQGICHTCLGSGRARP